MGGMDTQLLLAKPIRSVVVVRRRRRQWARHTLALIAALALSWEQRALGEEHETEGVRPLPVFLSVLPGAIVHGSGTFALGEKKTATKLLAFEGAGLASLVGGGATFWLSGAARGLAASASFFVVAGGAVLAESWFADIYGVAMPSKLKGDVIRNAPRLEAELVTRYVGGPHVSSARVGSAVTARLGPGALHLGALVGPSERYDRVDASLAFRAIGPTPESKARSGSTYDLIMAGAHTRHGAAGFSVDHVDLQAAGRLDLDRLGHVLRGSFVELSGGAALRSIHFDHGSALSPDVALLIRTAFGVALGREGHALRSEFKLYYDHRHDDDAGGLLMRGIVSGVFGHFGIEGSIFTKSGWGARAFGEYGSAGVIGVSLLYRVGGT